MRFLSLSVAGLSKAQPCILPFAGELFTAIKPKFVIDVTAGSRTNVELCNDFGIRVLGLDLKDGFNVLNESVLKRGSRLTKPKRTL